MDIHDQFHNGWLYDQWQDSHWQAALALHRFGYGARATEFSGLSRFNPREWLHEQLTHQSANSAYNALTADYNKIPNGLGVDLVFQNGQPSYVADDSHELALNDLCQAVVKAHYSYLLSTSTPFYERLVAFWMWFFQAGDQDIHFHPLILSFEIDVVRRFLHQDYSQMLLAAVRHPLLRLQHSRLENGLFEFSRSIIEKFTLGQSLPTQEVQSLANMLKGWSLEKKDMQIHFDFKEDLHDRHAKNFLRQHYEPAGVLEGEAALWALTREEATHHHISKKILAFFLGETITNHEDYAQTIRVMAKDFVGSDRKLIAIYKSMIDSEIAFDRHLRQIKSPRQLIMAYHYGFPSLPDERPFKMPSPLTMGDEIVMTMISLGQAPFYGIFKSQELWLDSTYFKPRLDYCQAISYARQSYGGGRSLANYALSLFGPLISKQLYDRIIATPNAYQALNLFFTSPEFQRI